MEILLVSSGLVHPTLMGRFWLRKTLRGMPGYRFHRVASLKALPQRPPASFQGMVLYYHHETISAAALESLENFVRQGGGILAIHSASASFKRAARYYEILGGRFVAHGPVETFRVQPVPRDDIFDGLPAFSVRDELYRHEYDPANRVHFYTLVDGEREPVVWTRRLGAGRVCYCALGHTASAMRHPQVRQVLQRGLAWACKDRPA